MYPSRFKYYNILNLLKLENRRNFQPFKPSICLLPYEDKSNHFLHDVQLTHFQEIFRSELFIKTSIIDNLSKDLFQLIKLANNKSIEKKLKSFSKYFVNFFDDPYKYRILQFVKKLI